MVATRTTRQKKAIEEAIDKQIDFFDAEELHETLKEKKISMATIYRYLKAAVEEKQLYNYSCENRQLYTKKQKSHCHFVCEETGKTIHFDIKNLDFIKDQLPGKKITSFQIEVKGICDDCATKE